MDLQTYDQATELLNKYRLCETMLEYLSNPDAVKGQKYNEKSGEFFKVFYNEMLAFTHELMTKCGEKFSDLHCECHTESETPSQPEYGTPPADAKYQIGDRVKVIGGVVGVLKGSIGTIAGYNSDEDGELFGVRLDRFTEDAPLYWYSEDELEPYVEEESPEESDENTEPQNPEENEEAV